MGDRLKEETELKELRKKIFLTGYRGGMAHLASCFSCLEILYSLYRKGVLRLDPGNPKWADRDRFILSKGHGGLALYSVLWKAGLIGEEMLDSYLQEDSRIGGEPCMRDCEWVEAATGSLGHGLSMGLGMAMALKMNGSPAKVYVLLGDGECEEGTVWEAAMMAAAFKSDNLTAILDCNDIQKMDFVEKTAGNVDWPKKWEAFGWQVEEVEGHDTEAITEALTRQGKNGSPRLIIAHTVKGKGVSVMEGNPIWHFKLPGKKDLKVFRAELGIEDTEWE